MVYPRHTIFTFWKIYVNEIWSKRELLYYFIWRDFKVRYKQTLIGIIWVILQPFLTMVVFSFIFGTIAKISTNNIPYSIYIYTGLLFWNMFAKSISSCSESLLANQQLVKKVAFPRIFLPLSNVVVNLIDFCFAGLVLCGLMFYYKFTPQLIGLITLPINVLLVTLLAVGLGLPLAIINVYFRDVRYIIPYALQLLLFLTPILYPIGLVGRYQFLFFLNPLSGIITTGRSLLLGSEPLNLIYFWSAIFITIISSFCGIIFFQSKQKHIADLL